jgi:hypothetical protein
MGCPSPQDIVYIYIFDTLGMFDQGFDGRADVAARLSLHVCLPHPQAFAITLSSFDSKIACD